MSRPAHSSPAALDSNRLQALTKWDLHEIALRLASVQGRDSVDPALTRALECELVARVGLTVAQELISAEAEALFDERQVWGLAQLTERWAVEAAERAAERAAA